MLRRIHFLPLFFSAFLAGLALFPVQPVAASIPATCSVSDVQLGPPAPYGYDEIQVIATPSISWLLQWKAWAPNHEPVATSPGDSSNPTSSWNDNTDDGGRTTDWPMRRITHIYAGSYVGYYMLRLTSQTGLSGSNPRTLTCDGPVLSYPHDANG